MEGWECFQARKEEVRQHSWEVRGANSVYPSSSPGRRESCKTAPTPWAPGSSGSGREGGLFEVLSGRQAPEFTVPPGQYNRKKAIFQKKICDLYRKET